MKKEPGKRNCNNIIIRTTTQNRGRTTTYTQKLKSVEVEQW